MHQADSTRLYRTLRLQHAAPFQFGTHERTRCRASPLVRQVVLLILVCKLRICDAARFLVRPCKPSTKAISTTNTASFRSMQRPGLELLSKHKAGQWLHANIRVEHAASRELACNCATGLRSEISFSTSVYDRLLACLHQKSRVYTLCSLCTAAQEQHHRCTF